MSNKLTYQETQLSILSLASIVGVITQLQLRCRQLVHRSRLSAHLDKLIEQDYLSELPARHYYALAGVVRPPSTSSPKGGRSCCVQTSWRRAHRG